MNKKKDVFFLPGTMCNKELWNNVFSINNSFNPINIEISECNGFHEINHLLQTKLPLKPSHLVGFSLGGYASLNFLLHFPERVKSLTLIASSAKGLDQKEIALRNNYIEILEENNYLGISESRAKQFLGSKSKNNRSIIEVIKDMDKKLGKKVLISQLKATTQRNNLIEDLKTIDKSVLLIGGEEDNIVSKNDLKTMHNNLKNSFILNIKNCGHMVPLEQPKIIAEAINNFVNKIPNE